MLTKLEMLRNRAVISVYLIANEGLRLPKAAPATTEMYST